MKVNRAAKITIAVVVCLLAGFIGSIFTTPSIPTWYASLNKPSFNPPNWLFGHVWTTLYILMGISAYLVWEKSYRYRSYRPALNIFWTQLILNVIWSIIFFGLKSPLFAFIEIVILWIAILFTILKFNRISKTAAYLLIPYILWVTFASVLNFYILILN